MATSDEQRAAAIERALRDIVALYDANIEPSRQVWTRARTALAANPQQITEQTNELYAAVQDGAAGIGSNPEADAAVSGGGCAPLAVQACRPEDRAMLQTEAGQELLSKAAAALASSPNQPAGWRLVPINACKKMADAARHAYEQDHNWFAIVEDAIAAAPAQGEPTKEN